VYTYQPCQVGGVPDETETLLPNSFCSFELGASLLSLSAAFARQPLCVQLVAQGLDQSQSVVGEASISLLSLLSAPCIDPDLSLHHSTQSLARSLSQLHQQNGGDDQDKKNEMDGYSIALSCRMTDRLWPISAPSSSPSSTSSSASASVVGGSVRLIMTLEDMGPVSSNAGAGAGAGASLPQHDPSLNHGSNPNTHRSHHSNTNTSTNHTPTKAFASSSLPSASPPSALSPPPLPSRELMEYQVAWELEQWRTAQQAKQEMIWSRESVSREKAWAAEKEQREAQLQQQFAQAEIARQEAFAKKEKRLAELERKLRKATAEVEAHVSRPCLAV